MSVIHTLANNKVVELSDQECFLFNNFFYVSLLISGGYLKQHGINPRDIETIIAMYVGSIKKQDLNKDKEYSHSDWAMTILQPELVYLQITVPENRNKFLKFAKMI